MGSAIIWAMLILVIIFMFKEHVSQFLNNINSKSKISYKGLDIQLGEGINRIEGAQPGNPHYTYLEMYQSPLLTDEKRSIYQQLKHTRCSIEQQIEMLVYDLANKNILRLMERIDLTIYNEQVSLLNSLNLKSFLSYEEAQKIYMFWCKKVSKETQEQHTFEKFMSYLLTMGVIVKDISGYRINLIGREYLMYRVKQGKPTHYEINDSVEIDCSS